MKRGWGLNKEKHLSLRREFDPASEFTALITELRRDSWRILVQLLLNKYARPGIYQTNALVLLNSRSTREQRTGPIHACAYLHLIIDQ